jgi:hypothetical protein
LIAGRWQERRAGTNAVFFHPAHAANADSILTTMAAARRRYSEWFCAYPWSELRIGESPALKVAATAFPTNISLSEGMGFLPAARDASAAFSVVAHEVAHQWWGHILFADDGPGSDLLVEGLANFSALLLHESERGPKSRSEFARQLERLYFEQRRPTRELPVLATEARTGSDEAVLSFKGAWVLWMLRDQIGEERMLSGLRALLALFADTRGAATPADLLRALRAHAPVPADFDAFVAQWIEGAILPEFEISNAAATPTPGGWHVRATIRNVGTGTVTVAIVAEGVETAYNSGPVASRGTSVRIEEGVARAIEWRVNFRPVRIVVDPDVRVLQLNRERAIAPVLVQAGG